MAEKPTDCRRNLTEQAQMGVPSQAASSKEAGTAEQSRGYDSSVVPTLADIDQPEVRLLGGQVVHSARDVAILTGTPIESVRDYCAILGFPVRDDHSPIFTQRDVGVYAAWNELIEGGVIDVATSRSLLRANAHLADRLSLWQVEALVEDVVRREGLNDSQARLRVIEEMKGKLAVFERMFSHSWQRQLDSLLARTRQEVQARGDSSIGDRFPLNRAFGFVDMVSFTSNSVNLGDAMVDLIRHFEETSRATITESGGRVVKMLGDCVLYIADDLETGLDVVVNLVDRLEADEKILPVRASLVRGNVFSRSGDVFGPDVNLASRLVDIAPVGKILTEPKTAAAISGGEIGRHYRIEAFPTAELRGFGPVSPYIVRPSR